jgi:hypothetical protein
MASHHIINNHNNIWGKSSSLNKKWIVVDLDISWYNLTLFDGNDVFLK